MSASLGPTEISPSPAPPLPSPPLLSPRFPSPPLPSRPLPEGSWSSILTHLPTLPPVTSSCPGRTMRTRRMVQLLESGIGDAGPRLAHCSVSPSVPPSLRPSPCPGLGPSAWTRTGIRPTVDGWHPIPPSIRTATAREPGTVRALPLEREGAHTIPTQGPNAPDTSNGSRAPPGEKARRPRHATDAQKWEREDRLHACVRTHAHPHTHSQA